MDNKHKILNIDKKRERINIVLKDGFTGFAPGKSGDENKKEQNVRSWAVLGYAGQIGFSIAIPIAGGAILGTILDREWNTYPKMTLSLLVSGIFISMIGFIKTVQDIIKDFKK